MDDSTGDTLADDAPTEDLGHTAQLRIGQADRYLLGRILGKGGMGEVLAATDEMIGREVAVKRMLRANSSERALLRFFREASIQGRLDHPAIVPVHELGIDEDGRPFFVMKRLTGTSMATLIDTNANRTRLLRAFCEVCLAVEFAHTRGVVHRDIKPDNILLGEFGEVYVIDWGVAKIAEEAEPELSSDDKLRAKLEIQETDPAELRTAYGVAVGTPGYMSPEQVRGARDVDGRADVYSLGCILFEILTGQMMHPRGDAGMESALAGGAMRPSERARDREVPPELDAIVLQATALERSARMQSARELGERVQLYLDGDRDIALRTQLATEHLVAAKDAFGRVEKDVMARAVAMREASRALALDPKLGGAAELLTRLMLEPPATNPPEVEHDLLADRLNEIARHSKTGMRGFIGYLALAPLLLATSQQVWYAVALLACVAFNCGVLLQKATPSSIRWRAPVLAVANATLIVLLARMFSPFLLAPGIAVVTACALVYGPAYERRGHVVMMASLLTAAILLPALGEVLGWFPQTVALVDGGVQLTGPALRAGDTAKVLVLALSVGAMLFSGSLMSFRMCSADRELRRKMQLQAWQLKQLVPEQARAATVS